MSSLFVLFSLFIIFFIIIIISLGAEPRPSTTPGLGVEQVESD